MKPDAIRLQAALAIALLGMSNSFAQSVDETSEAIKATLNAALPGGCDFPEVRSVLAIGNLVGVDYDLPEYRFQFDIRNVDLRREAVADAVFPAKECPAYKLAVRCSSGECVRGYPSNKSVAVFNLASRAHALHLLVSLVRLQSLYTGRASEQAVEGGKDKQAAVERHTVTQLSNATEGWSIPKVAVRIPVGASF